MTSDSSGFDRRLGEHLRRLRKQKGLSLLEVERASDKEFKASVLGAYERGERAISAARLERLAGFYRVPVRSMLPQETPSADSPGLVVDVQRLQSAQGAEADVLRRFLRVLQVRRAEWPPRLVSVRSHDVWALAASLGIGPQDLVKRLDEAGVRAF